MTIALLFVPGVYVVLLLSIVVSLGVVIAVAGGLLYASLKWFDTIPVGVIVVVALGGLFCTGSLLIAIVRTFIRRPEFGPGVIIDLAREPRLAAFLASTCARMGVSTPNCVVLHAEPVLSVSQCHFETYNGLAKGRVLTIGLPLLTNLQCLHLRALLVHELAHFTGRDTLFSRMVLPVYVGTTEALVRISKPFDDESNGSVGLIAMLIPLLMLNVYLWFFHLINMRISRLRELRADALATALCGTESFQSGLETTAGVGYAFAAMLEEHVKGFRERLIPMADFYERFLIALPDRPDLILAGTQKAYAERPSRYDSHPVLSMRVRALPKVQKESSEEGMAADLFQNASAYSKAIIEHLKQQEKKMEQLASIARKGR